MKKIFMLTLFFLFIFIRADQIRAVWVDTWHPGILSKSQIDELLYTIREANINTIVVEIRRVGDAYYQSNYEPRAENIEEDDLDPLGYLIEKAHDTSNGKKYINVVGWLVMNRIWKGTTPPQDSSHIYYTHPEWRGKDSNGSDHDDSYNYFVDFGVPAVIQHLVNVVSDIVEKYDIDGINLDYIRYPESGSWGYNEIAIQRFNKLYDKTGTPSEDDPDWSEFRRNNVTSLVKQIYIAINRIKPNVLLSADTITWGGVPNDFSYSSAYSRVFQNWVLWMQNHYIDINMPMIYKRESDSEQAQDFRDWINFCIENSYNRLLVPGIGIYLNSINDSITQINYALSQNTDGVILFSYYTTNNEGAANSTFYNSLKNNSFNSWQNSIVPEYKINPSFGYLAGRILDPDGIPMENINITLLPDNKTIKTEINGFFAFWEINSGNYKIKVESEYGTKMLTASVENGKVTFLEYQCQPERGEFHLNKNKISFDSPVAITLTDGNNDSETVDIKIENINKNIQRTLTLQKTDDTYMGTLYFTNNPEDTTKIYGTHGDTIILTYHDEDIGDGTSEDITASVTVDLAGPVMDNLYITPASPWILNMGFSLNEAGKVYIYATYNLQKDFTLIKSIEVPESQNIDFQIKNLEPFTRYYFYFITEDDVNNKNIYDNSGEYYVGRTYDYIEVYKNNFDEDPQWETNNSDVWQFGQPQGYSGTSLYYGEEFHDPDSGYTGNNVYGTNLEGTYPDNLEPAYLYSPPLNCTKGTQTHLTFYRWLSIEKSKYDKATIDIKTKDESEWHNIFTNSSDTNLIDNKWIYEDYDISNYADGKNNVIIRWGLSSDVSVNYGGWNIDDVFVYQYFIYDQKPLDYDFSIVSNNIPSVLPPNYTYNVNLILKNEGDGIWHKGKFYILIKEGSETFNIENKYSIDIDVLPEETYTFSIDIHTPSQTGTYKLTLTLEKENMLEFKNSKDIYINVNNTYIENYHLYK